MARDEISVTRSAWAILLALGLGVAVALRAWVLASPFGELDSDEAVWGLMARHALDGELTVFFWGQSYGGTQEVLLTAPVFAVAGSSTLALRVVPLALFAVAALLVWRIGRRTVDEPAARLGALLFAVWPAYLVWKSTQAHGFYGSGLVLSLLVLLFALRLVDSGSSVDLVALGLAVGVGWWATPQTAFVVAPALVWLAWRKPALLRRAWIPALAAAAGASPWLVWNALNDWQSLTAPFGRGGDTYFDHLRTFFYANVPVMLGLRVPFSLEWLTGELVGRVLEAAALVMFVVLAVRRHTLLLAVLVAYPLLEAATPYGSLNEEPRYLVLLAPVLALLTGALLARSSWVAVGGSAALVALSVAGLLSMSRQDPPVSPVGGIRTPADLDPVLRRLDGAGVRYVLAPYAIAYRISFLTNERILATSTGQVRYEPHDELVRSQALPAYVFAPGEEAELMIQHVLEARRYRRVPAGDWAVYLPQPTP